MASMSTSPVVLIVDDDAEDIYLAKRSFGACNKDIHVVSVSSGAELFDYLDGAGKYIDIDLVLPWVILLDINMPTQNGFEIISILRGRSSYSHIPIVMLTTSDSEQDISRAYQVGANSYLCKSASVSEMESITAQFCEFWLSLAKLPRFG